MSLLFSHNSHSRSVFTPKSMETNGHGAMVPAAMTIPFKLYDHGCSRPSSEDVTDFAVCAGHP